MTLIAHISDIHLSPLPAIRISQLLNKRATGYLNWRLKRGNRMSVDSLEQLMLHMQRMNPDFIALTGDLINLGLPDEIRAAYEWMQWLAPPDRMCVSPGNHDAYVRTALPEAMGIYGKYLTGETLDSAAFPFVRRVNEVAIISCSSAVTTPPFIAAGHFDKAQAERLARILKLMGDAGYFRVVMIHHPPCKDVEVRPQARLFGADRFRSAVAAEGAELVLHGHTHNSSIHQIPGKKKAVPVIGVASASSQIGSHQPPARYNLFQIHKPGDDWSCTMREYGFQRLGDEIVQRVQLRIH